MKKLNPLDEIILEGALDDFKKGNLELKEVTKMLGRYEERKFNTHVYRTELRNTLAKKYVESLFGK